MDPSIDVEFVGYRFKIRKNSRILPVFKIRKNSFLHVSIKHKAINVPCILCLNFKIDIL